MDKNKRQRWVRIKSAYPVYAVALTWLLWGLLSPIYDIVFILLACATSVGVYFVCDKLIPGRSELVTDPVSTGDAELDSQLAAANATIKRFREMAINDSGVKDKLKSIADACERIADKVAVDRSGEMDVYTFFSYYLPTLYKLFAFYEQFQKGGAGENVEDGKKRIENCLDTVKQAFEKLLDDLYKNTTTDVKTEIAVMETMLRSEGLSDKQQVQTSGKGGIHV